MLEHLVQFEPDITSLGDFRELDDVSSGDLLSAQVATTDADRLRLGVCPSGQRTSWLRRSQLLEECKNPSANIRLKALGLLGKVTEVGLFTDKIEVKKTDLTDEEIDRKLKDKLAKFMGVQDADVIEDIEEVSTHSQDTDEPERSDTESN
jgi:hypothetical protein